MYENAPGTKDLIYHTAKHFLDAQESRCWDRVPAGTLGAAEAHALTTKGGLRPPPAGTTVDPQWWWPPWGALARDAHSQGYRPRYELLLALAGDPDSPRWEPSEQNRRLTEYVGFRLIVQPSDQDWQVITAFFSPACRGAADLPQLAPALRAFAARRNCPPAGAGGVPAGESKT